ncbi:DNA-directed RNA polymerases iii 80 kda polypeptide RNA polymerase iii subunit [Anaeramoeba flamelloides]|uniref:DNA-directed RNA polymerases iii 80 kDa polypeptide RNA polymerase iii subunit n=1 Tax=Anaeramoeba flamelloides TaxID=1746091 RepID=A0AAV7ZS81_9EUKA|nr:DNA-directed RNA polymerases iii 80 kda polypeptide RNA polymerase iii subunit [Anaeramoeba flamelloides]
MSNSNESSEENSGSDSDPVIEEIPVYLNQLNESKIILCQYPLKRSTDSDPFHLDIQKNSRRQSKFEFAPPRVEMHFVPESNDFVISTHLFSTKVGETYSVQGEEKMKQTTEDSKDVSVDIKEGDEENEEENGPDSYKIEQVSRKINTHQRFAFGLFKNEEFHLTPIDTILQFVPDFSDLDPENKTKKKEQKKEEEANNIEEVQINYSRVSRTNQMLLNQPKGSSGALGLYRSARGVPIEWKKLNFTFEPKMRNKFLKKLQYNKNDPKNEQTMSRSMDNLQYIRALNPIEQKDKIFRVHKLSRISEKYLRPLDLKGKVQSILINSRILHFKTLFAIISSVLKIDKQSKSKQDKLKREILKISQQQINIIRGCFVIKSELLKIDLKLKHARNMILSMFDRALKPGHLSITAISKEIGLNKHEIISLIKDFAEVFSEDTIKLIIGDDDAFPKNYPSRYEFKKKKFQNTVSISKNFLSQNFHSRQLDAQQSKNTLINFSTPFKGKTVNEQIKIFYTKIFKQSSLILYDEIKVMNKTRILSTNKNNLLKTNPNQAKLQIQQFFKKNTLRVGDYIVLKKLNNKDDQMRLFCIQMLKKKKKIRKNVLSQEYEKKYGNGSFDPQTFKRVMRDIGIQSGGMWSIGIQKNKKNFKKKIN